MRMLFFHAKLMILFVVLIIILSLISHMMVNECNTNFTAGA